MVAAILGIVSTANQLVAKSGGVAFNGGPYAAINLPSPAGLGMLVAGIILPVAGVLGIWRSKKAAATDATSELSKRTDRADTIAMVGLIAGSATLLLGIIPGVGLALWPVPISATLICWLALALGTRRYRRAILGLVFGSLTVLLSGGLWLLLLFNGNGSFS